MPPLTPPIPADGHTTRPAQAIAETLLIFLLFAAFAGQPAPDVNESHYLTKAKHFWDPSWCPGDLFLGSSFSHWLFYICFGWITKFTSLTTFAWIGRIGVWLALAWSWQRLSQRLQPRPFLPSFAAIVFLLLNERFHLAGEWVVGGFESKGIAYVFVTLALGDMVIGRWRWVWPWLGAAAAFHVLVGGWAMLASGFSWWVCQPTTRKSIRQQLPTMLLGIGLLAIGAIPPLLADQNASVDATAAAQLIYVQKRIAHHLAFDAFPTINVARFVLMLMAWFALFRFLRRPTHPPTPPPKRPGETPQARDSFNRLFYFGIGSLIISMGGLLLSGLASSEAVEGGPMAEAAARLLRFYWFRLSDFAIPATSALAISWLAGNWLFVTGQRPRKICAGFAIATLLAASLLCVLEKNSDPRPNADRKSLPSYPDNPLRTQQLYKNWKKVCRWIEINTPNDAVFITPYQQQTFRWNAGRTEVVNWKDVPQDAEAILEWNQRVLALINPQKYLAGGLMSYSDDQLREIAHRFGANYLLLPQWQHDPTAADTDLEQIYPVDRKEKATFVVLKIGR